MTAVNSKMAMGLAIAGAGIATILAAVLIWYVIQVIAHWRIFTKGGEAGWKSIIPFYNEYTLYKLCWQTKFFWINIIAGFISSFLYCYSQPGDNSVLSSIAAVLVLVSIVIYVMRQNKLSKSFGHGVVFTLGLIFLDPIFKLILGLGSSQYKGADL